MKSRSERWVFTFEQAATAVWQLDERRQTSPTDCIVYEADKLPHPLSVRSAEYAARAETAELVVNSLMLPGNDVELTEEVVHGLAGVMTCQVSRPHSNEFVEDWASLARLQNCTDPGNIRQVLTDPDWPITTDVRWLRDMYEAVANAHGGELSWRREYGEPDTVQANTIKLTLVSFRHGTERKVTVVSRRSGLGVERRNLDRLWLDIPQVTLQPSPDETGQRFQGALAATFAEVAWRAHMEAALARDIEYHRPSVG